MLISPSLLACPDWVEFKTLLKELESHAIDSLHIDVMDGHFVPNLAFGPDLVRSIAAHTKQPLDIHLMINCLDTLLDRYIALKPRIIYFHPEACADVLPYIHKIKTADIQAGLAIHPDYPMEQSQPFWHLVEHLLIMTVYPGFSGQKMLPEHIQKSHYAKMQGFKGQCWVDGGIKSDHFPLLKENLMDGAIMGSSYFNGI